jgi:hypothetical protein
MTEKDSYSLRMQISHMDHLESLSPYTDEFKDWYEKTDVLLMAIFGAQSHPRQAFQSILYTPLFLSCRCSDTVFSDAFHEGLEAARALLESLVHNMKG